MKLEDLHPASAALFPGQDPERILAELSDDYRGGCVCVDGQRPHPACWLAAAYELVSEPNTPVRERILDEVWVRTQLDPDWLSVQARSGRPCCTPLTDLGQPPSGHVWTQLLEGYRAHVHEHRLTPADDALPQVVLDAQVVSYAVVHPEQESMGRLLAGRHLRFGDPDTSGLVIATLEPDLADQAASTMHGLVLPPGSLDDASWPLLNRLVADARTGHPRDYRRGPGQAAVLRDARLPAGRSLPELVEVAWNATH